MGMIEAINPTDGKRIAAYDEMSPDAVKRAIETANERFLAWRGTGFAHRADRMRKAAAILRANAKAYGRLMAEEMGKPVKDGAAEANKSALGCDYYAEHAEKFLAPEIVPTDARKSFVAFRPLGVILAVMPWNFPFWQVFRAAAPALMAGNAMVLKHASNVPGCALAIEKVFVEAGFPEGLFRTLMIGSKAVEAVIEHPLVRGVTLTGSTAAGRAVAAKAGQMLKKTVLELGGSDAYVVLDDADIEQAAQISTKGRIVNSGQSCIAAKRFIVTGKTKAGFEAAFVKRMAAVKMGDPLDETNEVGPQARHDLRDELHRQVEASIAKGAKCLLGGTIPNNQGAFYPPTILTDVKPGMPAYDEELFGPVAAIIPVANEDAAFAAANDSVFGLGGAIIARDLARAERLAVERMDSGTVFVNDSVRSDPRLPFGGIKESGYGRELSAYGIREFVNIKTVFIA
jgi:succinate-semialdehyde dehydrogenase/glutarate-semialdehyde dehydrogenase